MAAFDQQFACRAARVQACPVSYNDSVSYNTRPALLGAPIRNVLRRPTCPTCTSGFIKRHAHECDHNLRHMIQHMFGTCCNQILESGGFVKAVPDNFVYGDFGRPSRAHEAFTCHALEDAMCWRQQVIPCPGFVSFVEGPEGCKAYIGCACRQTSAATAKAATAKFANASGSESI